MKRVDVLQGYRYHTLPSLAVGVAMSEDNSVRHLLVHDSKGMVVAAIPVEVVQPWEPGKHLQLEGPCVTQEGAGYLVGLEMVTGMKGGRKVLVQPPYPGGPVGVCMPSKEKEA